MADKGGDLVVALGLGKKKPGMGMGADEKGMDTSARHDAAQALIDAVKGGDPAGVSDAMQTMYDLCSSGGYEEGDEDEG